MALYRVCRKCNEVVEVQKSTQNKSGMEYIVYKCPKCGDEVKTTINYIHYGDDMIKK